MEEDNKETLLENETGDVVPNEAIDENIDGMVGDDEEVISPIDSNSHLTADKTKSNINNKLSVLPWVLSGFSLLALSIILSIFVNGFIAFGIIPALFIVYKGISNNNKNNKKKVEPYNIKNINFEKTPNIEQKQEIEKNKTQDHNNKLITKSIKGQKNSNQKQKNYEKPSIEDFQKLLNFPTTPSKEQKKGNHSNVNMDDVGQDNNQMDFLKEYNNKQNKTNTNNKKVDFDLIKNSKQENTNNIE